MSTDEQVLSGAGLGAQRAAVTAAADRQGLTIDRWAVDEGVSGSVEPAKRPELGPALSLLASCRSGVLLFAKLDRLTRSARDWQNIAKLSDDQGWSLVAADGSVETVTPQGRMMAGVMAQFADFEREMIGTRTREGMAAKKAMGVRMGRGVDLAPVVRERISQAYEQGQTLTAIASALNADGVATARGGARWYPSTVQAVLRSLDLDREAAEAARRHRGQ